jgi:hypothetical protein
MAAKARKITSALLALVSASAIAVSAEPFCQNAIDELKPKTFLAKEPLYDTKIAADGILRLERDKQEIRKGAKVRVVDIECEKNKLELTLKPVDGGSKVEIVFFLSVFERSSEKGKEIFEKMLSYVFEKEAVTAIQ